MVVSVDDAFDRILDRFESADRQQIQQMKKEKTKSKPPKKPQQKVVAAVEKEPDAEEEEEEEVGPEQQQQPDKQSVLARLKAASRGRGARRRGGAGARTAARTHTYTQVVAGSKPCYLSVSVLLLQVCRACPHKEGSYLGRTNNDGVGRPRPLLVGRHRDGSSSGGTLQ